MSVEDDLFYHTSMYHNNLSKMLEPMAQYFGVSHAGIFFVNKNLRVINIHTSAPWIEYCMENKLYLNDPHIVDPSKMGAGFSVCNMSQDSTYKNGLLHDSGKIYNMCNGVSFSRTLDDGGYFAITFVSEQNNPNMPTNLISEHRMVDLYIKHLMTELRAPLKELSDNCIDLKLLKGSSLLKQTGIVPVKDDNDEKIQFLTSIKALGISVETDFSSKEKLCLKYFLKGFVAEEISQKLFISRRTVETYLTRVRRKLACCNDKKDFFEKINILRCLNIVD